MKTALVCGAGGVHRPFERIYQLAADMGGAGFIVTGKNDAEVTQNSATINLNEPDVAHKRNNWRLFSIMLMSSVTR